MAIIGDRWYPESGGDYHAPGHVPFFWRFTGLFLSQLEPDDIYDASVVLLYVLNGVTAYLINGPEELVPDWLESIQNVGITSGASTPDLLVERVINALDPEEVITVKGAEEDISFVLPLEMR